MKKNLRNCKNKTTFIGSELFIFTFFQSIIVVYAPRFFRMKTQTYGNLNEIILSRK